jgi:hypothetical protein
MLEILRTLAIAGGFMPHGYCYLWKPGLVWLHVLSDSLIAVAYYTIPSLLVYFVRKRRDLPFNWIFLLFGSFIGIHQSYYCFRFIGYSGTTNPINS